jgi:hypothetical protein
MASTLYLGFGSPADLRSFLGQYCAQGTVLLPRPAGERSVTQFETLALQFVLLGNPLSTPGEVLQLLPDGGLVVRLIEPDVVERLAGTSAAEQPAPPEVSWEAIRPTSAPAPRGFGPTSWPMEKLTQHWRELPAGDRINVARRGDLGARRLVLKTPDPRLHVHLLENPQLTAAEIAAMAGMPALGADLLKRIASRSDWLQHTSVVRNLLSNPKLPLDLVPILARKLQPTELRQLTRGGRVREPVKRIILKLISA